MPLVDVEELMRDVVTPVLDQLLRPGELTSASVSCPLPWSGPPLGDVLLRVVAVREELGVWLWTHGQVDESAAELRARLASDLQDLVAESRFGWAQQRPYRAPS